MEKKRIHYAWAVCAAATMILFCCIGICNNMYTVYLPYIQQSGITSTQGSTIITVRSIASFVSMLFIEGYFKKLNYRNGLALAMLMAITSAIIFSIGGHAYVYYIAAVIAGFATSFGGVMPLAIVLNNWFIKKRGLAIGILACGTGIATITLPPIITAIAEKSGLRAAFLFQVVILSVFGIISYLLLRNTPSEKGLEPLGSGILVEGAKIKLGYNTIKTSDWWIIIPMMLFMGGACQAALGHISILFTSNNYPPTQAATFVSFLGISMIVSKLLYGSLCDKIGSKITSVVCFLVSASGCMLSLTLDGAKLLPCYLIVIALGFGFPPALVGLSFWANDIAYGDSYAKTFKWLQIIFNLGSILATSIPGRVYAITGEYKSSFIGIGVGQLISLILLFVLYTRNERRRKF